MSEAVKISPSCLPKLCDRIRVPPRTMRTHARRTVISLACQLLFCVGTTHAFAPTPGGLFLKRTAVNIQSVTSSVLGLRSIARDGSDACERAAPKPATPSRVISARASVPAHISVMAAFLLAACPIGVDAQQAVTTPSQAPTASPASKSSQPTLPDMGDLSKQLGSMSMPDLSKQVL